VTVLPGKINEELSNLDFDNLEVTTDLKSDMESSGAYGGYAIYRFESGSVDYKLRIDEFDERIDMKLDIKSADSNCFYPAHSQNKVETYSNPSFHSTDTGVDSISATSSEPELPEDTEEAKAYLKFTLNRIKSEEGANSEYSVEF